MELASSRYTAGSAGRGDAWAEEAAEAGRHGSQLIAEAGWHAAAEDVATALGVAPGSRIATRRRIVLLDGKPIEIADSYYPEHIATGTVLPEPRKIKGGSAVLLADLGHVAASVRETVSARTATPAEREILHLSDTQPVLILRRTTAGADGVPFEYSVMTMTAEGRELHYNVRSE